MAGGATVGAGRGNRSKVLEAAQTFVGGKTPVIERLQQIDGDAVS
ncbi:hypothetical protein GCM10007880_58420 [Mesorhizobium amorphae]|nr:hypothetical protein GCM10007880_58420 [Mesorhizobium amorphae]